MNGLETVSETEIFESLEFEPEFSCDHPEHEEMPRWHSDDGKVWWSTAPCGVSGYRCDKWRQSVKMVGVCRCSCEKWTHEYEEVSFTTP